jgi:hypothetical protein
MAQEVSLEEFGRKLTAEQRRQVEAALSRGQGLAMYSDGRGGRMAFTYGSRDADIVGLPPRMYGGGELEQFVSPAPKPQSLRSPLLAYHPPPQVHRPRVAPTQTQYPEVLISGRSSSHPRGNSEYITPLLPSSARQEPVQSQPPQEPLSEGAAWWRDQLSR